MLSKIYSLNLKLCSKQYNKNFLLHLIMVPQLGGGWWHNYSTKTRLAGHCNEQSMYSVMSVPLTLLTRQTRQVVRAINQSIFLRCLWWQGTVFLLTVMSSVCFRSLDPSRPSGLGLVRLVLYSEFCPYFGQNSHFVIIPLYHTKLERSIDSIAKNNQMF
jgi:hypothetical protein